MSIKLFNCKYRHKENGEIYIRIPYDDEHEYGRGPKNERLIKFSLYCPLLKKCPKTIVVTVPLDDPCYSENGFDPVAVQKVFTKFKYEYETYHSWKKWFIIQTHILSGSVCFVCDEK